MFIRIKATPNSPRRSVQICESRRTGNKVSQRIVRHVGVAMDGAEEKELLRLAEVIRAKLEAEQSESLPMFAPEDVEGSKSARQRGPKRRKGRPVEEVALRDVVEEQRVIEGIGDVFGRLFDELGFAALVEKHTDVLRSTVLARIANPVSKHRTAALLEEDFGIRLPLDRIYRMMDALYEARDKAQDVVRLATMGLFREKIDLVFFDVTTLYFESVNEDELRGFGYSKDQKFHSVQVVLALATTEHGLPVGYRLFHGATAEVSTLLASLDQWRKTIDIGHVVLVADRAMMSEENLRLLEERQIEYIVGASLRKQKEAFRKEILDGKGYRLGHVEDDPVWVNEFGLAGGRRLITGYSARRARKDASDRTRIIEKLEKKLGKKPAPVKKLISNRGYLKYSTAEGKATVEIDPLKVARDALWDGMYGIITNSPLPQLEVLARYRRLWVIEESFRISKHDLAMRPIFHFKPERIEAHVAICYLAYALLRHAQNRIRLQQKAMSVEKIRNELLRVQSSLLRDKIGGGLYRLPSHMSEDAKAIYRAFAIDRHLAPSQVG